MKAELRKDLYPHPFTTTIKFMLLEILQSRTQLIFLKNVYTKYGH